MGKSRCLYKTYCDEFIECFFCKKYVNLYHAKPHIKTKKCVTIQNMLGDECKNELIVKYFQQINKLKCEVRLRLESEN